MFYNLQFFSSDSMKFEAIKLISLKLKCYLIFWKLNSIKSIFFLYSSIALNFSLFLLSILSILITYKLLQINDLNTVIGVNLVSWTCFVLLSPLALGRLLLQPLHFETVLVFLLVQPGFQFQDLLLLQVSLLRQVLQLARVHFLFFR